MRCSKCNAEIADGARFCDFCGAATDPVPVSGPENPTENAQPGGRVSANITLCPDGKYRWTYEMSLFKNPTIFWLIWKIFFFIITAGIIIALISDAINRSDFFPDILLNDLKFYAYFLIGMTALVGIGYLIYAAVMGGKYIVDFEMDENGVDHIQTPSQAKKAKSLGGTAAVFGASAGSPTVTGAGMNAQRTSMYTEFARVKKVKPYPSRNLIKISETIEHNQVYASKEDFEFVKNYIISHCVNAKNKN